MKKMPIGDALIFIFEMIIIRTKRQCAGKLLDSFKSELSQIVKLMG